MTLNSYQTQVFPPPPNQGFLQPPRPTLAPGISRPYINTFPTNPQRPILTQPSTTLSPTPYRPQPMPQTLLPARIQPTVLTTLPPSNVTRPPLINQPVPQPILPVFNRNPIIQPPQILTSPPSVTPTPFLGPTSQLMNASSSFQRSTIPSLYPPAFQGSTTSFTPMTSPIQPSLSSVETIEVVQYQQQIRSGIDTNNPLIPAFINTGNLSQHVLPPPQSQLPQLQSLDSARLSSLRNSRASQNLNPQQVNPQMMGDSSHPQLRSSVRRFINSNYTESELQIKIPRVYTFDYGNLNSL